MPEPIEFEHKIPNVKEDIDMYVVQDKYGLNITLRNNRYNVEIDDVWIVLNEDEGKLTIELER